MGIYLERAKHLFALKRTDKAIEALRSALADDPENAELHALLAFCFVVSERYDAARLECAEALRLGADLAVPHHVQAELLNALDKSNDALKSVNEAIRIDPNEPDFYALRAGIHVKLRGWVNVRFSAEHGLQLDPGHVGCINLLAMSYFFTDDTRRANEILERALELDPESPLTYCNLGWQRLSLGDFVAAELRFRESLRLDPNFNIAQDGLGIAMLGRQPAYKFLLRFLFQLELRKLDRRRETILFTAVMIPYLAAFWTNSELFPKFLSVVCLTAVTIPFQLLVASNLLFAFYHVFVPYPRELPDELIPSRWRVILPALELAASGLLAYFAYMELKIRYAFGVFALMPLYLAALRLSEPARSDVVVGCLAFLTVFGTLGFFGTFPSFSSDKVPFWCGYFFILGLAFVPHFLDSSASAS